jgi:hypothetical protein
MPRFKGVLSTPKAAAELLRQRFAETGRRDGESRTERIDEQHDLRRTRRFGLSKTGA